MSEATQACIRGCTMYRYHLADCEHAEDDGCRGCLPQRATVGHLCTTCHRRFELMIHDAPGVVRWLSDNISTAGSKGAKFREDHEMVVGGDADVPAPVNVDLVDMRDLIRDRLTLWVDDWCEHKGLSGPDRHTAQVDADYLLMWLPGVCGVEWVGDWWTEMAETMSQAHALAPWRPTMRRIKRVQCPGCGESNLAIFGGEADITCLSCRIVMTEERFALWERVLKAEQEQGAEAS